MAKRMKTTTAKRNTSKVTGVVELKIMTGHRQHLSGSGTHSQGAKRQRTRAARSKTALQGW